MKITQIKQQVKNPERVSIFLDGKYTFSLTLDQLLNERLKKEDELDEQRIKELKKLSDEGKIRARALEWLLSRPHSTREFRDYLYRKKAEKDHIEALVEEFTDRKYLDDESFAKWFVELRQRKNKSKRAISSELYSKGVSSATIQSIVSDKSDDSNDPQALINLVNKLSTRPRYSDTNKLTAYLISKGFSYGDVKQVLKDRDNKEF